MTAQSPPAGTAPEPGIAGLLADLLEGMGEGAARAVDGIAGQLVGEYVRRRAALLRGLLARTLGAENLDLLASVDRDALIAGLFRLQRAVLEGSGELALTLMIRVFAGTVLAGDGGAERFLSLAEPLATLSESEGLVLGCLHRQHLDYRRDVLAGAARPQSPWHRTRHALVPQILPGVMALEAACGRLARTGLVLPVPMVDGEGWQTGALADSLFTLVPVETLWPKLRPKTPSQAAG